MNIYTYVCILGQCRIRNQPFRLGCRKASQNLHLFKGILFSSIISQHIVCLLPHLSPATLVPSYVYIYLPLLNYEHESYCVCLILFVGREIEVLSGQRWYKLRFESEEGKKEKGDSRGHSSPWQLSSTKSASDTQIKNQP